MWGPAVGEDVEFGTGLLSGTVCPHPLSSFGPKEEEAVDNNKHLRSLFLSHLLRRTCHIGMGKRDNSESPGKQVVLLGSSFVLFVTQRTRVKFRELVLNPTAS